MNVKSAYPIDRALKELLRAVNGRAISPDDPGYEEARTVFYGGFDRRPAVIVRVADATDVARVVSLARDAGIELAVQSGGHSTAGHRSAELSPRRRRARERVHPKVRK